METTLGSELPADLAASLISWATASREERAAMAMPDAPALA
jgi:hypothetical protein